MSGGPKKYPPTLCWNCSKATGRCRWSASLMPIKDWKVIPTRRETQYGTFKSLIVVECPEFDQDAYDNGMKRLEVKKNDTL